MSAIRDLAKQLRAKRDIVDRVYARLDPIAKITKNGYVKLPTRNVDGIDVEALTEQYFREELER